MVVVTHHAPGRDPVVVTWRWSLGVTTSHDLASISHQIEQLLAPFRRPGGRRPCRPRGGIRGTRARIARPVFRRSPRGAFLFAVASERGVQQVAVPGWRGRGTGAGSRLFFVRWMSLDFHIRRSGVRCAHRNCWCGNGELLVRGLVEVRGRTCPRRIARGERRWVPHVGFAVRFDDSGA